MKKLSKSFLVFASAAMILANGFFVSCSNGDDGDSTPTVTTPKPGADNGNNGGNQNGNGSGNNNGNQNGNDNQNNGGNQNGNDNQNNGGNGNNNGNGNQNNGGNENTGFTVPDLSSYYKKYFVTSDSAAPNFGKGVDTWGSGAGYAPNSDGSIKLTSAHMWNANATEGVVAAFNDIEKGVLAGYEYIVFTVDGSEFNFTNTSGDNDGVNVQIPNSGNKLFNDNFKANDDGTKTFYIPISKFGDAPRNAVQLAIIIGGTGTLKVNEIYAAAKSDPSTNIDSIKASLRNALNDAKTLLETAENNKGSEPGKYSDAVVSALSNAVADVETELAKDNASVDSLNSVSQALTTAVSQCVINSYKSPVALTENVNATAKIFVTDEKISGEQLNVTEYTQKWNGEWTTTKYTTTDSVEVKVVKFISINNNACGAWVFDKSNILTPSNGKTLYLHFDYISSSAFDINFPQGGDHWLTPSENSTKDANGWTSADISLSGIDMTEVSQFGWRSKDVQNIYVTNAYFYEK